MPRRATRVEKQSAHEQIMTLSEEVYITSDYCYAKSESNRALLNGGSNRLACGCRDCKPELWCTAVIEGGKPCPEPKHPSPVKSDPALCVKHQAKLWRERRRELFQRLGAFVEEVS